MIYYEYSDKSDRVWKNVVLYDQKAPFSRAPEQKSELLTNKNEVEKWLQILNNRKSDAQTLKLWKDCILFD